MALAEAGWSRPVSEVINSRAEVFISIFWAFIGAPSSPSAAYPSVRRGLVSLQDLPVLGKIKVWGNFEEEKQYSDTFCDN